MLKNVLEQVVMDVNIEKYIKENVWAGGYLCPDCNEDVYFDKDKRVYFCQNSHFWQGCMCGEVPMKRMFFSSLKIDDVARSGKYRKILPDGKNKGCI